MYTLSELPDEQAAAWRRPRAPPRRRLMTNITSTNTFLQLRAGLQIRDDEQVVFERYSDSAAAYVTLDSSAPAVYKTLFRAAKAKLKLRLRATVPGDNFELPTPAPPALPCAAIPDPSVVRLSSETLTPQVPGSTFPVIVRSPEAPKFEAVSPVSPLKPADDGEVSVPRPFAARHRKHRMLTT